MSVTTTTIADALKRVYKPGDVANMVYQDNPLYAMMQKEGDFDGSDFNFAVKYRDPLTYSPTFTTAQGLAQSSTTGAFKSVQFRLTRVKGYQLYTLETEAILAAKRDVATFLKALTTEVNSALNDFGRNQARQLYRDGAGELGQITAVSGAGPYTFTVGAAITNFEVGMSIAVSTGSTKTALLRSSGASITVASVDRAAGTFTTAAQIADPAVANDWVFVSGSRPAAAISAAADYYNLSGLDAWVPATAPSSTAFFGVDRSVDSTRLGGLRQDVSSYNPEEGLVLALNLCAREGGRPSHYFTNFADMGQYQNALGSKAVTEYMSVGKLLFSSIRIHGPKGDIRLIPDQNCQSGVGWLLDMSTWRLKHLGDLPNMLDMDGSRLSREYNADRFEGRMAFYGNVYCTSPGSNMRLVLPT